MEKFVIKRFNLDEVNSGHISQLKEVFSKAYYNGSMYEDFLADIKENPKVFKAFFAHNRERIIGVVILEIKLHKFIEYFGYDPIHIQRFTVLPEFRSQGIGKELLDEAKKYAFEEKNIPVIFGETNGLGALSFYGREGALYSIPTIKSYSHRNSPEENLSFFIEYITNPKFVKYRYPKGEGIPFVFCKSDKESRFFKEKGFVSKQDLLRNIKQLERSF